MDEESNDNIPLAELLRSITSQMGNDLWSTRGLNDGQDVANNGDNHIVTKSTLMNSFLIEGLIKQLSTMLEQNPENRNKLHFTLCDALKRGNFIDNSYNLDEYDIIRGQFQSALYQLVTIARSALGHNIVKCPNVVIEWSRYRREFEEIKFIGSGGFGQVYKAKHYLDGHEYAIKKICMRPDKICELINNLREVRTLAVLNHTNIITYKGAWIEGNCPLPSSLFSKQTKTGSNTARVSKCPRLSDRHSKSHSTGCSGTKSCRSNLFKDLGNNNQEQKYSNDTSINYNNLMRKLSEIYEFNKFKSHENNEVLTQEASTSDILYNNDTVTKRFEQLNTTTDIIGKRIDNRVNSSNSRVIEESDSDIVSFRDDCASNINDKSILLPHSHNDKDSTSNDGREYNESIEDYITHDSRICKIDSTSQSKYIILYIHMALCDQTLRQWMDKRFEPTTEMTLVLILTQILAGLQYIHSRSIVHHDIKPSNIFITTSGQLHIQLGDFGLACPRQDGHRPYVGTQLYAAPEQLDRICNPKSDVYSLGIVLFELLVPMSTSMERIEVIKELKSGNVPECLTVNFPKWAEFIKRLVVADPDQRPSSTELLNELNEDKDSKITQLTIENEIKESTITDLKQENLELREKLCQLQTEMNCLKIQN